MAKLPPGNTMRGKRFGVRIYDPTTKNKQRWVGTFDTLELAKDNKRRAEREQKAKRPGQRLRVGELTDLWLARSIKAEGTYRANSYGIKRFREAFEDRYVDTLTPLEMQVWVLEVPISSARTARTLLNYARKLAIIVRSPFEAIELGKSDAATGLRVLSIADLTRLATYALSLGRTMGTCLWALILTAAYTGLRPGELFGLAWDAVDFDTMRIHVRGQRSRTGRFTATKGRRNRLVAMPPVVAHALLVLRAESSGVGSVFTAARGGPLSATGLYYYWQPIRLAAGLPATRFYDLRHFCATRLLEAGVFPHRIAKQLGHADNGQRVIATYLHPNADDALLHIDAAFASFAPDPKDGWKEAA